MKILVVDDKQAVLDQISSLLTKYGHQIELAHNGLDAFEKAQKTRYDLFVVDHLMPLMNGLQLAKNLKQTETTKATDIIFITTQDVKEVALLPEAELFSTLLPKPIDENLFMQVIETRSSANSNVHSL